MASSADAQPRALIDLHCHLIPAIDDGCQSLTQTVLCLNALRMDGFTESVCTPHVVARLYPRNIPHQIARHVERLSAEMQRRGIEHQFWPGGEVRLARDTVAWMEQHGVPTIGPGRCVLIDYWGAGWPDFCDEACGYLIDRDYQPVLAHPERMGLEEPELLLLLDDLRAQGVWLQGNLNSFTGGEGPEARDQAIRLLQEDRYAALATDMHGPESVSGRRAGLREIATRFGEATVRALLEDGPRKILHWNAS